MIAEKFVEIDFDCLDIDEKRWLPLAEQFWEMNRDHEKRLGAILVQGLDDSPSLNNAFKIIDSYDNLLSRKTIQQDAEPKLPRLLEMYEHELAGTSSLPLPFRSS